MIEVGERRTCEKAGVPERRGDVLMVASRNGLKDAKGE